MKDMNLKDHFLIASPRLDDERFIRSVVYICEHNAHGAMGLIINKINNSLLISDFLSQLNLPIRPTADLRFLAQPIMYGGPISYEQGFILHTPDCMALSSLQLTDSLAMTTSRDILQNIGTNKQPEKMFIALGHATWAPRQLEAEIAYNDWFSVKADHANALIFDTPISKRWQQASYKLGFDITQMTNVMGHA